VTIAVANGDLSKKITSTSRGRDPFRLKETINTDGRAAPLVCLRVTRVAREVGTEGRWRAGGRSWFAGTWKDLTDSVNFIGSNLTARSATLPNTPPVAAAT